MRILHINCNYISTALHQSMIEHLDKFDCNNSVFAPTYDKKLSVITVNDNVLVSECFKKWDRIFFDYKQGKIYKTIENNYNINEFDIFHAYTLFTDGNIANKLSKKHNKPYVVAVRNTDVNTFFRFMPHLRKRGIKIMRDASAIFFLSETYRKQVFDEYIPYKYHRELENKTFIIPNGIDDFWLNNTPKNSKKLDNKIKLIYAGRIDKNKNITTTQGAMEILRQKGYDVSLTVVGKVADKKEFDKICKDKNTQYIPAMPKEDLIKLYRGHDIFVMPSHTESFGLVYAEAMSQGLPVIYTKGQGFDCQFEESVVGFHVKSDNILSVAEGIEKIIKSYDFISKNVVNASQKFNWDKLVKGYLNIYNKTKQESEN